MANSKMQARRESALKLLETQIKDCGTKMSQTNDAELKDAYQKKLDRKHAEVATLMGHLGRRS